MLVWQGEFRHGLYGSDLPLVRSEGTIDMSPLGLVRLLMDNARVSEYNKMSLGRDDIVVLQDSLPDSGNDGVVDPDGDASALRPFGRTVTKVVKSATRPPVIRRNLEFVTLLHARPLDGGGGGISSYPAPSPRPTST